MAIGKRIKFFRNRMGLTQRQLGEMLGFQGNTSDVRMAQYESEARTPKADLIKKLADIYKVRPEAITVPDIDNYTGLMHTFFALEDMYGLTITEIDGEVCLHLDKTNQTAYLSMLDRFLAWQQQADLLQQGEITREEYDQWRYNYPDTDTSTQKAKVPSLKVTEDLTKK